MRYADIGKCLVFECVVVKSFDGFTFDIVADQFDQNLFSLFASAGNFLPENGLPIPKRSQPDKISILANASAGKFFH